MHSGHHTEPSTGGYDAQNVRNLAAIVLEAQTHVGGGSINVWLARDLARAALKLADAAGPMAHLPVPVSSDERVDWLTHQWKLKEALGE